MNSYDHLACGIAEAFHCLPSDIDDLPVSEVIRMYDYLEKKNEEFEEAKAGKKSPRGRSTHKADPEPVKTLTPSQFKAGIQKRA